MSTTVKCPTLGKLPKTTISQVDDATQCKQTVKDFECVHVTHYVRRPRHRQPEKELKSTFQGPVRSTLRRGDILTTTVLVMIQKMGCAKATSAVHVPLAIREQTFIQVKRAKAIFGLAKLSSEQLISNVTVW